MIININIAFLKFVNFPNIPSFFKFCGILWKGRFFKTCNFKGRGENVFVEKFTWIYSSARIGNYGWHFQWSACVQCRLSELMMTPAPAWETLALATNAGGWSADDGRWLHWTALPLVSLRPSSTGPTLWSSGPRTTILGQRSSTGNKKYKVSHFQFAEEFVSHLW